jgi:formylmethanofuran dehydrogenase subunit E
MPHGREDDEKEKMICINCNAKSFKVKRIAINVYGKDIECFAWVCDQCLEPIMDTAQMNELRKKAGKKPG